MVFVNVHCPGCDGLNVAKHGSIDHPKTESHPSWFFQCVIQPKTL